MNILNQLAVVLQNEEISVKDYLFLFNIMISCEDLGVLPQGLDNVQFGQADRMRADNPKSVYIFSEQMRASFRRRLQAAVYCPKMTE